MNIALLILLFVAPAMAGALTYLPGPVGMRNVCLIGALALLFASISPGRTLFGRMLVIAIVAIASLLLVFDVVSYKVTGAAVNYYFWEVVSWPAIKSSMQVFPGAASLAVAVLILPLIGGFLFLNTPLIRNSALTL
jgi:hypothetical protein